MTPIRSPRVFCGLLMGLMFGCANDFTDEEMAALKLHTITALPRSPSNRFADDARAAKLGQQFYFDTRFAGPLGPDNNGAVGMLGNAGDTERVACASCHELQRGGSDKRSVSPVSLGAGYTLRNAPSPFNVAYVSWFYWDGRKDSLWSQALSPVESVNEKNFSRLQVAHVLDAHYRAPYETVFGSMPDFSDVTRFPALGKPGSTAWENMTAEDQDAVNLVFANFGKSIEAYERLLVSRDSPFDRSLSGDMKAMSYEAKQGAKLFVGRAGCNECHSGPAFSDGRFHNTGVAQSGAHVPVEDRGRAAAVLTVKRDAFNRAGRFSDSVDDSHLATLDEAPNDEGAFKTPRLRGVSQTAPYMHNGSMKTLSEVVEFYARGGDVAGYAGHAEPVMTPLRLTREDIQNLVAFLESLDGAPLPEELLTSPELP